MLGERVTEPRPVPFRITVCGLPMSLSLTDRVALCDPALCGVEVTEIVQLAPAASELPQLLLWENWVFESAMLDMFSAVDPMLLSLKETGALLLPTV